jgi:hypothetical protein
MPIQDKYVVYDTYDHVTLEEILNHYKRWGIFNVTTDLIAQVREANLSAGKKRKHNVHQCVICQTLLPNNKPNANLCKDYVEHLNRVAEYDKSIMSKFPWKTVAFVTTLALGGAVLTGAIAPASVVSLPVVSQVASLGKWLASWTVSPSTGAVNVPEPPDAAAQGLQSVAQKVVMGGIEMAGTQYVGSKLINYMTGESAPAESEDDSDSAGFLSSSSSSSSSLFPGEGYESSEDERGGYFQVKSRSS